MAGRSHDRIAHRVRSAVSPARMRPAVVEFDLADDHGWAAQENGPARLPAHTCTRPPGTSTASAADPASSVASRRRRRRRRRCRCRTSGSRRHRAHAPASTRARCAPSRTTNSTFCPVGPWRIDDRRTQSGPAPDNCSTVDTANDHVRIGHVHDGASQRPCSGADVTRCCRSGKVGAPMSTVMSPETVERTPAAGRHRGPTTVSLPMNRSRCR